MWKNYTLQACISFLIFPFRDGIPSVSVLEGGNYWCVNNVGQGVRSGTVPSSKWAYIDNKCYHRVSFYVRIELTIRMI